MVIHNGRNQLQINSIQISNQNNTQTSKHKYRLKISNKQQVNKEFDYIITLKTTKLLKHRS